MEVLITNFVMESGVINGIENQLIILGLSCFVTRQIDDEWFTLWFLGQASIQQLSLRLIPTIIDVSSSTSVATWRGLHDFLFNSLFNLTLIKSII